MDQVHFVNKKLEGRSVHSKMVLKDWRLTPVPTPAACRSDLSLLWTCSNPPGPKERRGGGALTASILISSLLQARTNESHWLVMEGGFMTNIYLH